MRRYTLYLNLIERYRMSSPTVTNNGIETALEELRFELDCALPAKPAEITAGEIDALEAVRTRVQQFAAVESVKTRANAMLKEIEEALAGPEVATTAPVAPAAASVGSVVVPPDATAELAAKKALRAQLTEKIAAVEDADALATMLVPELDLATRGTEHKRLRADIQALVQARLKALTGRKPTVAEMRELFPPAGSKPRLGALAVALTHYSVASQIVQETAGDLRFNIDEGSWLRWDQRRWMTVLDPQIGAIARAATNSTKAVLAQNPDIDPDKLASADSDAFRRGVVGELTAAESLHVERAELDTQPRYLAAANGAIDTQTGALVHERDLLVTVRNDTEYNPEAECLLFLKLLGEVFEGRAEDIAYYELIMGYSMLGNPAERAMFFHKGEGRNGKSLLLGAIMGAVGQYAAVCSYQLIADAPGVTFNGGANNASPALRRLLAKRFAYIDELPLGSNLRDADVKLLAGGGGLIIARALGKEAIEFEMTAAMHIACNNLPTVRGGQIAAWNRIFPIAYLKQFDGEEDTTLAKKLEAEREGILAWLVRCAQKYLKMKAEGGKIRDFMPDSARAELANLKTEQNPFAEWIAANCEIVEGGFLPAIEGWQNYMQYEEDKSLDGARIRSVKAFVARLTQEKIGTHATQVGKGRVSGFWGIRLKDGFWEGVRLQPEKSACEVETQAMF
jgi:putative DNA primase/helicase